MQMTRVARLGFLLALTSASEPSLALAHAQAQSCLNAAEAQALVQYAMPDVIGQLGKSCAVHLPATAYLTTARAELVERYAQSAFAATPLARTAIAKVAGIKPRQAAAMRSDTLRDLMGMGIAQAVGDKMKPGDCRIISEILEQLAPLPPENMARLIGIAMREGNVGKIGEASAPSPLQLCDAQEGA